MHQVLSRGTDTEETVSECWFLSLSHNKIINSQTGITSYINTALKEAVTSNICGIHILNNNERNKKM